MEIATEIVTEISTKITSGTELDLDCGSSDP